jgi:hypothetical protein
MRRTPLAAVAATVALVAAGSLPAAGAVRPSGAIETVTLLLAAPHGAAVSPHLTGAARSAALGALRPAATEVGAVEQAARGLGLTVDSAGPFSVVVSGPAALVRSEFGSAAAVDPTATTSRLLPQIPAALAHLVTAAAGGDDTRRAVNPLSIAGGYSGSDLRAAYQVSSAAPTNGSQQTVATLQFDGWNSADLTTYAQQIGLSDPVASGQYTAVPVLGADPSANDGTGGATEVALDEESILSVDPHANERAYFAPNSDAGFIQAASQVLADATSTSPNYHIVALSISWGACEQQWATSTVDALDQLFAELERAGVTVFASSGDDGATDCTDANGNPQAYRAVDFPASDPNVVGVGGTRLSSPLTTPSSVVWNNGGSLGAGGGGVSTLFARPSWQQQTGVTSTKRTVPDISADADQLRPGFEVYSTDSSLGTYAGWLPVGGTSLASPAEAAMLAETLSQAGLSVGVGDIHDALYSAPSSNFYDVTSGNNSYDGVTGYAAGHGYDMASGLGSPLWSRLGAPVASAVAHIPNTTINTVSLGWTGSDLYDYTCQSTGGGACSMARAGSYQVTVTRTPGGGSPVQVQSSTTTNTALTVPSAVQGSKYTLSVHYVDGQGRTSSLATSSTIVPVDDSAMTRIGTWVDHLSPSNYMGGAWTSYTANNTATLHGYGDGGYLWLEEGPGSGYASIYVDGHGAGTIDLYRSVSTYRVSVPLPRLSLGAHTIVVKVLGTHDAHSKGTGVSIDAVDWLF